MFRLLGFLLISLSLASPLGAQQDGADRIDIPFSRLATMMQVGDDGEPTGFSVELSRILGAETGIDIGLRDFPNVSDAVKSLVAGQTQMIAGIAELPALRSKVLFSDPVAIDHVQIAVLSKNIAKFDQEAPTGLRIGVSPPVVGIEETRVIERNIPVEFPNIRAAMLALLLYDVDAVMAPGSILYSLARRMDLDGRIQFLGDPVRELPRHVALHQSKSDHLPAINAAIARLEADGRLEALRRKYKIVAPLPPPPVLTVGVFNIPPLINIDEGGDISGLAVENLRELAARARLDLRFVEVSRAQYLKGPDGSGHDIQPALIRTRTREEQMDFTIATQSEPVTVFVRSDTSVKDIIPNRLNALRVAASTPAIVSGLAEIGVTENVQLFDDSRAALKALMEDRVDAFVGTESIGSDFIEAEGLETVIKATEAPLYTIETAIPLRLGLGPVRESLDAVIPGYLISEQYLTLRDRYYGEPVFWTPQRIYAGLAVLAMILLALVGQIIWQNQRRRRDAFSRQQIELANEQAHSAELASLVTELERSNRELDQFAYIASHDLKEPLRGLRINANFLGKEKLTATAMKRVQRMSELAGNMEQLISDLMYFARLGRGDDAHAVVHPGDLIDAIRKELHEWLVERGGDIVEVSALPSLIGERTKLKVILQNLIVNGLKYNDADAKKVEIGFAPLSEVNGKTLKNAIFVRDNGIGIGEQYRDKVFRIFSRLNKEADYGPGAGSGLAFVRKIVEAHGGQIDFTSEPGGGTTFYIVLPLAADKA